MTTTRIGLAVIENASAGAVPLVNANAQIVDLLGVWIGKPNTATDAQTTYALGTPMFQLQDQIGVGNSVDFYWTKHTTAGSGLQGLHLRRKSTNTNPHGVTLEFDTGRLWDTIAIDATTDDLILAYSHLLATDNVRLRRDTAQMAIGPVVGQPAGGAAGQIQLYGGTAASPRVGLAVTCYGSQDGVQILQGNAGTARAKINLNDGFQLGVDSASANVKDFWLSNNATGGFPLMVGILDLVTVGTNATGAGLAVGGTLKGVATARADLSASALRLAPTTITMGADANLTLTAAQYSNVILQINNSVTLNATRNIVLPLAAGSFWIVANITTGAPLQSLQFIGASGTGVTVANGKRCLIASDGTSIQRLSADV